MLFAILPKKTDKSVTGYHKLRYNQIIICKNNIDNGIIGGAMLAAVNFC